MTDAKTPQRMDPQEVVKWLVALRRALENSTTIVAREPAQPAMRLRCRAAALKSATAFFQIELIGRFTTAAQPSGSKLSWNTLQLADF